VQLTERNYTIIVDVFTYTYPPRQSFLRRFPELLGTKGSLIEVEHLLTILCDTIIIPNSFAFLKFGVRFGAHITRPLSNMFIVLYLSPTHNPPVSQDLGVSILHSINLGVQRSRRCDVVIQNLNPKQYECLVLRENETYSKFPYAPRFENAVVFCGTLMTLWKGRNSKTIIELSASGISEIRPRKS
jgi:hypothetical protein